MRKKLLPIAVLTIILCAVTTAGIGTGYLLARRDDATKSCMTWCNGNGNKLTFQQHAVCTEVCQRYWRDPLHEVCPYHVPVEVCSEKACKKKEKKGREI